MRYRKEFDEQAKFLAEHGCIDEEIADFFRISVRTLHRWKKAHPAFAQALELGKDVADDRVEASLYKRAVGYRVRKTKVFMPAGAEEPVYAEYDEDIIPDVGACMAWLKNRRPHKWRERKEITGADGGPIEVNHSPRLTIEGKLQNIRKRLGAVQPVEDVPEAAVIEAETDNGEDDD